MKVLISADMEGTVGVVSWVQVTPPEYGGGADPISVTEYERVRVRMTREVNAAVEGALRGGAEEVIVNDSHDGMRNLNPEELHPSVRFISGNDKPLGMVQGADIEGVGALFYTGYHARAGTPAAPLAHTWTGWLNDVRFDGVSVGEYGINAAVAGHFGVPVALVTGDEKAVAQTRDLLGEAVIGAVVKEGFTTFAGISLHPERAQDLIRMQAEVAVRKAINGEFQPYRLTKGVEVALDFDHQARADQAAMIPTVERLAERTVTYRPADGLEFNRVFRAVMRAASIRMAP